MTTLLLKSGDDFTVLTNARKLPGTSIGNGKNITGTWLRGSEMNAGLFPKSVADKLRGKTFNNFDEFRQQFWREVSADPDLVKQFTPKDIAIMKNGYAPEVLESQRLGGQIKYVLHHKTPINRGGAVYDVDNLYIVTPKYHKEILDPAYHYGYGY
ncbi:MAG: HNH endonuclease [Pseudarcicella sp.]|nr:HNH endonuclease [Pseudarcicella sp.]